MNGLSMNNMNNEKKTKRLRFYIKTRFLKKWAVLIKAKYFCEMS